MGLLGFEGEADGGVGEDEKGVEDGGVDEEEQR